MLGSQSSRWLIVLVSGALSALGCVGTTDTGSQSETGSLSVNLVLADGLVIDELGWQITGNGMDMSGDVDVSAPGSTASVEVFGLPPGETDYTVTLTATSNDEKVTCEGSAPFNVEVGQTTDVMVMLNCKKPRTLGGVRVNGKFNICTQLTKTVVSPLQTSVGNDISLSAQAFDEEGDAITYIWTGTGGAIADPSAASTTYTCQDVGDHTVMIMVTDNDVYCRMATWTIPVTCVEGDGGDLCEDVICEDDGNECTETACNPANGACETSNVEDGTECDGGTCSGGVCVEVDLCEGVDCNDDLECTADACDPANGTCSNSNVENGTPCADDTGMCVDGSCVDVDLCEGVVCDDTGNECTVAMCNTTTGECDTMNVADGTACNGGVGACSAGVCIDDNPCEGVDCTSDNDCVQDGTCDPADGLCDPGDPQPADTACDLAATDDGFCDGAGACVACNADAQCPDDGNECTAEACTSNACSSPPVADGTMCDNDMGVCDQGECLPANLCEGVDCSDGNECTQDLCDPTTGDCSNPAEADGTMCMCPICGADGLCDMGVCVDPCDGIDCSDGNQCTADLCNVGVCSNPNVGPGATCDQEGGNVCDGAGTCVECISEAQCASGEACVDNACEAAANPVTCEQFNPNPAQSGTQGLCEKAEFIAIDCELLANSAPLPLNASAQAVDIDGAGAGTDIAFAGVPIGVFINDAFVLPSDLVCGFLAAGFSSSGVANSILSNDLSNADVTNRVVNSFLDDGSDSPNLVSPHGVVPFSFAEACGDDCVADGASSTGFSCLSNSTVECEVLTFTDTCPGVGTGPGIFAPFFYNAAPPGTVLVDSGTGELTPQVPPVMLTPTASGSVDFTLDYATTAIELVDLVGSITTDACVGGACTTDVCSAENFNGICDTDATCSITESPGGPGVRCSDDLSPCTTNADCAGTGICFGTSGQTCTTDNDCPDIAGPRIMYEATCNKLQFEGGTCTPFDAYADVADVCKGAGVESISDAPPCCRTGFVNNDTTQGIDGNTFDTACDNADNRRRCCAQYADDYPDATEAQQPQLWVN